MRSLTLFSLPARRVAGWALALCSAALLAACQTAPDSAPAARPATPTAAAPVATPATAPVAAPSAAAPQPEAPEAPIVGHHTDAHGCKPSTGHAWCARTNRCERPWELALQRGFANTPAGWHAYCEGAHR